MHLKKKTAATYYKQTKQILASLSEHIDHSLMHQLVELINYHEYCYYIDNDPVISDKEFDTLFSTLVELETKNPKKILPDSPTQRVSNSLTSNFESVTHLSPMLSLENSYNKQDIQEFNERIIRLIGSSDRMAFTVEPKYDGGTIALVYENNHLVRAATRGNGEQGDDITQNAKAIRSIPLWADFKSLGIHRAELRGEVLINKNTFTDLNLDRQKKGEQLFANPRNAATGGLRMKDPKMVSQRKLDAFIYQISVAEDESGTDILRDFKSHSDSIDILESLGFKTPEKGIERLFSTSIDEIATFCSSWEEKRESFSFELDGMVIKLDDFNLQEQCGFTSHHPRWAIAFKFKAKQATTKLLAVDFQVGRTGAITPVARLEGVDVGGATITNVSLHNEEFILEKDIRIGDQVIVERAGDVIPYIVKSLSKVRSGEEQPIDFPTQCPSCSSTLEKPIEEAVWRCVNEDCTSKIVGKLIHFVSKDAMNIDGFGEAYVHKFFELGMLKSIRDIYQFDFEKLSTLEGFGAKSVENLREAIDSSRNNPAYRLLYALGIRYVGKTNAKTLIAEVDSLLDFCLMSVEQLCEIHEIGPKVAEQVYKTFQKDDIRQLILDLQKLGVNIHRLESEKKAELDEDNPFNGTTFLFTGTLQQLKRNEAKELVEKIGAKNVSAVSGKLSYLVVGEKAGSKLKKAKALGIHVLSEKEFLAMIKPYLS